MNAHRAPAPTEPGTSPATGGSLSRSLGEALAVAVQHHQAGRLQAAEQIYRQILQVDPNQADAIQFLGLIAHQVGQHELALEYIGRAIASKGNIAGFHYNLGRVYDALHRIPDGIACYRRALELDPAFAEAHNNLGNAFKSQRKLDEAIGCYRRALELKPGLAEVHNNLGNALKDQGWFPEAIASFHRALAIEPNFAEAHNNLGIVLVQQGKLDEGVASLRQALVLHPNLPQAYNNLGLASKDQGNLDLALASFRRAVELAPDFVEAHSNVIYTQVFRAGCDAVTLHEEHQRWNHRFGAPWKTSVAPHLNDRSPERRLRVGYVSPDFRDHCQAFFVFPLWQAHDHERFEIHAYSSVHQPDPITERLRRCVDCWHDVADLSDEALAAKIRADQIDILIDLSMHMGDNRLLVFARKPAPVQACWLAYPGTTGLSAIDYRLTDPHLDPPGLSERYYAEETIRLPDTFWCYDPLDPEPGVGALPAAKNGYITFGCLNNFCKVNPGVLNLWAQVLKAVEGSRLKILSPEGLHRDRTLETLAAEGVARHRITFTSKQPRPSYLKQYHGIDIGLDTVPYNGHTTNLDSYWMGVPVVTLVGPTVVGRAGLSQLTNLGLPELIAHTPEQYVQIVSSLAHDLPRLTGLRSTLRERMQASPLMDAPRFTRNMEAACRQMWRRWCARQPVRTV